MKRTTQDYAGRPVTGKARPSVMGGPVPFVATDVASFLDARRGLGGHFVDSDERVMDDFAEFLSGDDATDPVPPTNPDPDFRESLRRYLWRLHLIAQPKTSKDSH